MAQNHDDLTAANFRLPLSMGQIVALCDHAAFVERDGRILAANAEFTKLVHAKDEASLVGRDFNEFVVDDSRQAIETAITYLHSSGGHRPLTEIGLRLPGPSTLVVNGRVSAIPVADGKFLNLFTYWKIVSDHPAEDLQGMMIPVRTILETAMDGIILMNDKQRIILFNDAAEAIFGWKAEEVIGKPIDILIPNRFHRQHQDDVSRFGREPVSRRRMGAQRVVLAARSTGEEFPIEASISKTLVNDSLFFTVILRDVTESWRNRQKIEQQAQMLDQVSDAVSIADSDGRITYWNSAAVRMYGWDADESLGRDHRDLLYRGDPNEFRKMKEETDAHGSWVGEVSKSRKDGSQITVEHRRTVLRDAQGGLFGYLCIDIDITERKKRERAARRSQRLESIGTLAGGIAHDLNNVLTPILMGAKLLSSGRASVNREGILETLVASAHRGTDLIKQLLAFAGGIRSERCPIDIGQLIAETRQLMDHTLPKSIRIETRVEEECPQIMGEATEVSQILMNLCINARDAMQSGGTLTLEALKTEINQQSKQLHPDAQVGPHVLVKVSDTGCGMTGEVLDRIFDPFFTTKEVGKGTGLGLATVQGIVKSYGGFINVYSEVGLGTTFSIYLPSLESKTDSGHRQSEDPDELISGKTILLVDDEAFILQMTSTVLEANGYRVISARDGMSAIQLFTDEEHSISLVLLDMMMPGLDGIETLDRLRKINFRIPVIACSGLRTSQRETEVKQHGAFAFLPKPYTEDQLLHVIASALKS